MTSPARQPPRTLWVLVGIFAGTVGLLVSYGAGRVFTLGPSVLQSVARMAVPVVPTHAHEVAEKYLGLADRGVFMALLALVGLAVCAYAGAAAGRHWWEGVVVLVLLAGVPLASVLTDPANSSDTLAATLVVLAGLCAAVLTLVLLGWLLRREAQHAASTRSHAQAGGGEPFPVGAGTPTRAARRDLLVAAVLLGSVSVVGGLAGQRIGAERRKVAASRNLLRLSALTPGVVPAQARVEVPGVSPWRTRNADFFVQHTVLQVPTIDPEEWTLRVHGLVDVELVLSYRDLLAMAQTEAWVTLGCIRNPIGGSKIGNAWWSGVRVADVLARAGVQADADTVLQTSHDGWSCATPLGALTDSRNALLAVGMNGAPLPLAHGFPVRTVVPGLNGHVSACKWVVDFEVTRLARIEPPNADWEAESPIALSSRIDVPSAGETVAAGPMTLAGMAWGSRTGVAAVEVALDGGPWRRARSAHPGVGDTWLQWSSVVDVKPGEHEVRVRAVDGNGVPQPGVPLDPKPGPASGWHTVRFTATEA